MPEMMTAYRLLDWERPPELVTVPVPRPGSGQAVVEVAGCGLCHSDLTMQQMPATVADALGWRVPFTLGHETAGVVVEVGSGVTAVGEGDAVVVVSASSCGTCELCRMGLSSACLAGDAGRGYGRDGGLAGYVLVDDPRDLVGLTSLDPRHAGPLTDAGATSAHAVRLVAPVLGPGSTAVVIGVGGLGTFAVQILRATTEARVVAVDLDPFRRSLAADLGAHEAIDGAAEGLDRVLRTHGHPGRGGVDAVLDVVGTDATIAAGLGALRRGGTFVLVGAGGGSFRRPWFGGLPRDATVTAVQGSSADDVRQVVALAEAGAIRVEVDEFPLERVEDAYAALEAGTLRGRAVVVP